MKGVQGWVIFAVAVLVIVGIALRVEFTKNLLFGTTTSTK